MVTVLIPEIKALENFIDNSEINMENQIKNPSLKALKQQKSKATMKLPVWELLCLFCGSMRHM